MIESKENLIEKQRMSEEQGDQIEIGPMRDKIFQRVPPLFFKKISKIPKNMNLLIQVKFT